MLKENIVDGSDIELEVKIQGQAMSFKSQVFTVIDSHVLILPIKVNSQTLGFSKDCVINFLYKNDGKLFIWNNVSVKLVKYMEGIYHSVILKGDGQPYNRRGAYRLYVGLDMPLYINSAKGPLTLSVLVKDISEKGVAFITKEELELDRTFFLKFKDGKTALDLSGSIVRKEFLKDLDSYLYGCKYNKINKVLPKYIATKQAELLKKRNMTYNISHKKT